MVRKCELIAGALVNDLRSAAMMTKRFGDSLMGAGERPDGQTAQRCLTHQEEKTMSEQAEPQRVPVKMYESPDRLTVAAPMPGLEPEDIAVEVTPGNQLVLHGSGRGVLKGENYAFADEWNPGPYCRELLLPSPVDGSMANITFRNGILVVVLPLAETTRPAHLAMEAIGPGYGERAGNAGHPVRRISEAEHAARMPGHQRHHA